MIMRTDILAFYAKWWINRIREGYVMVRNPYYPKQVTKYRLNPDVIDCIDFCSKKSKYYKEILFINFKISKRYVVVKS